MWICPKCNRTFAGKNQSHYCSDKDPGELFLGKPDELVRCFDALCQQTLHWEPNSFGVAVKAIVFSNPSAWLIVTPMTKWMDLKIYADQAIDSPRVHKQKQYGDKFAIIFRVQQEHQVNEELIELLRIGYDYARN